MNEKNWTKIESDARNHYQIHLHQDCKSHSARDSQSPQARLIGGPICSIRER